MQYPGKFFGCRLNQKSSCKMQVLWTAFIFLETKFKDRKKERGQGC